MEKYFFTINICFFCSINVKLIIFSLINYNHLTNYEGK